jgi:hypothetical protein
MAKYDGCIASIPVPNANPDLKQLGQAFFDSKMEAMLGSHLVNIFRDIGICTLWQEYYRLAGNDLIMTQMDCFNCLRWRSHFLVLNLPFENQHVNNNLRGPCRIALIIFFNANNQVSQPGSLLYRTLAAQLRNALEEPVSYPSWERSRGLLAWILLLGAFITEGEPEYGWFSMEITFLLQRIGRTSWNEIKPILLRFLYLERIFQAGFARIWNSAVGSLTESTQDSLLRH